MGRRAATPRADAGAHGGAGSADKPDKPFAGLRAQLRATTSTATAAPPPAKRIRHTLPPDAADTSSQTPVDSAPVNAKPHAHGSHGQVRGQQP